MKQKLILLFSIGLLNISAGFAQRYGTVKGSVTTSDNQPAIAVTIGIKNTSQGTITNASGHFQLNKVKPGDYTISVSSIGLITEEKQVAVTAGGTITINFTLKEDAHQLNEVAVLGKKQQYKVDDPSASLRLNEPLVQIPQNIQVVTSDQIRDQQIYNMLEGASRNVSGLTMQEHWGNYARVNARGDRLAPFRNGVNLEADWGPLSEDMAFVDRIEFVKGPAGFMLANGNPSGFYNVVTKKPTGVNSQSFEFSAGSFDTYRATADLDGNITRNGKLQYRLNLMGGLSKSWRPYDFTNRFGLAPVLRYKFDDKNTITAEYTYQYQRMNAFGSAYLFSTRGYADLPRNFTFAPSNSPAADIYDQSAFLNYEHKFSDNWKATIQGAYFNYKQNAYSYWINTIMDNGDVDRNLGLWDAVNRIKSLQAYVNGEVQTGAVKHRILGGADLGDKYYAADYLQSASLDPVTPFNIYHPDNGPVTLPVFDRSEPLSVRGAGGLATTKYQSVYVQDELGFFGEKLRLTLAGRFTHATTTDPYAVAANNRKITPRVGLSYSLDEKTSLYGVYDQSFLPQNGHTPDNSAVKPVTGNNLEAGIKRDWFNGKWSTSLSVYQIIKNGQLVPATADPSSDLVLQLGQAKTNGVEFDARGEIINGLSLMANYAYTNSRISKDIDTAKVGNPIPGFAKHVTNTWLTYRLQKGGLKGLGFSAGYQWQLNRIPWSLDTKTSDLPNYFRLDAGASYNYKRYSLNLVINNVLDTYLYSGGHEDYTSPEGKTVYSWQAEAPRTIRVSIGYKF